MNKICFILPALLLCACSGGHAVSLATPASAAPVVQDLPPPPPREDVVTPVTIELSNSRKLQAVACKDDLDCFTKLTGLCPNGYEGGHPLVAENNRRVAVAFECITDEQKAKNEARKRDEEAQEKVWQARRAAELKEYQDEQNKKKPAKKATSSKK